MTESVSFQTRARTIDHLGREQIADVPTAVSELWKNAYDAYAREVSLHIYGEGKPVAVIMDDGHGMSKKQFIEKWLVVGTESKAGNDEVPLELRQGLSLRPKQGQKGIGRLSVAALGSVVLVISKQVDENFVGCLIDWRIFENPYLLLQDVKLPVVEFESIIELERLLPNMKAELVENLDGSAGPVERTLRLRAAWKEFDDVQSAKSLFPDLISEQIRAIGEWDFSASDYLDGWKASFTDNQCGTALIMTEINPALSAWTLEGESASSDEVQSVKASLIRTLSGFSDPYTEKSNAPELSIEDGKKDADVLDYKVVLHSRGDERVVVGSESGYGIDFLRSLDHCIEGSIDEYGVFRGRVRAFGEELGDVELIPAQTVPTSARDRVGPFSICIGAFEVVPKNSTLDPAVHSKVELRAESHSGLNIYRDGLRVMPYGRPENDFFKIEERRQFHAGREFWASRRMFGRIAITREDNPNLRDKAGREGLIDNTACRAMQILMIDLLKATARKYFGTDSTVRQELLPGVEAENAAAEAKAKALRSGQLSEFKRALKSQLSDLEAAYTEAEELWIDLQGIVRDENVDALWLLSSRVDEAQNRKSLLRLPPKPKRLGRFEDKYREYRDRFAAMAARVDEVKSHWAIETERLNAKPSIDVARSRLGSNQKFISDRLSRWRRVILDILKLEQDRINERVDADHKEFYKTAAPLLLDLELGRTPLRTVLDEMDNIRDRFNIEFSDVYEPYFRSIKLLSEGKDLDSAFAYSGARTETLETRLEQIQGLAQIGISVEILGHELHSLDRRLRNSLNSLPESIKESSQFKEAEWAREELVDRLRFLSQMQLSGSDIRQRITGADIEEYLRGFFRSQIQESGVDFVASEEFKRIAFNEFPSRVYPVFINLINNSLYWVADSAQKTICLSVSFGKIVLSDSGPGIDSDDVSSLFELFFSRRIRGRGVGLYLCRQTLAAGGHTIEYAVDERYRILPGANFVISLRNGFDA
ncbi:ATP-binding protein [Pseudomonas sp. BN515]|uniref:ATP-binding protein n=1 Tax=Pseudomonas sp. BN515 TaxID=2567892 RepID=UPI0024575F48|nr:ATP-binding protein [Pseudomonas sp. BN515]MDH4870585.1 ATP-binding protein [Pseudomonas sp. BN515]